MHAKSVEGVDGDRIKIQKISLYGVKLLSICRRTSRTSCMYACKNVKEE